MTVRAQCAALTYAERFHLARTIAWSLLIVPAVKWWSASVPFLVFISLAANIEGAGSSLQNARAERRLAAAVES